MFVRAILGCFEEIGLLQKASINGGGFYKDLSMITRRLYFHRNKLRELEVIEN